MNARRAHLVTIAFIVLLGAGVAWRSRPGAMPVSAGSPATAGNVPQDAIYAMFDAERQGDVETYLASYSGQLGQSLRQASNEMKSDAFARSLRERSRPVKGIAIASPAELSNREVKATVEYVYADRNEKQTFWLEKFGNAWKITRVDGAEWMKAAVPYGTPVQ